VLKLPFGVNINSLIDDIRTLSWEAADIMLYYSNLLKDLDNKDKILQNKNNDDPVTIADLKVNELIIQGISEKYSDVSWGILSEENAKLESFKLDKSSDWLWVLDPLDGTKDFVDGTNDYAMHLALNYNQKPILGIILIPEREELWIAYDNKVWCEKRNGSKKKTFIQNDKKLVEMTLVTSKNHRNNILENLIEKIGFKKRIIMGSIGCKLASIVRGESDLYITSTMPGGSSPKDWDFAAPEAILNAAGGAITNVYNQNLSYGNPNFEQRGILVASNNISKHKSLCLEIKRIIDKHNICSI